MSDNYIEIDGPIAKIHKDGKVCTLKNPNNVKVLLDICHKHNLYLKSNKGTIKRADKIIKEFDEYRLNKKRQNQKLKVVPNNITILKKNINLVRRNPIGKAIAATSLAAVIGITSIGISSIKKSKTDSTTYETQAMIEEVPEYVEEETQQELGPILAPTINYYDDTVNYEEDGFIDAMDDLVADKNIEINKMLAQDTFHFSYNDRTNEGSLSNAKKYEDLFIKYGNMYGVDPNLLMAMAAQESSGDHYGNLKGNYGIGIMQIEKKVHINSTLKAYNFETGEIDSIKVTEETISDLETNIQMGTIILRNNIEANNYNIPLALQSYNFGAGNMNTVLNSCSDNEGILKNDLKDDPTNSVWLSYRKVVSVGDPIYVEHVFSYIPNNTVISIKDRDGYDHSIKVVNDNVNTIQYN